MNWKKGAYQLTDDKININFPYVIKTLNKNYWAKGRPKKVILKSIENSVFISMFLKNKQIGYARIVSDFSSFAWICDVFIDAAFRGKGLGKFLLECVGQHPATNVRLCLLGTKDAHGLYEKYGFTRREMMWKLNDYAKIID